MQYFEFILVLDVNLTNRFVTAYCFSTTPHYETTTIHRECNEHLEGTKDTARELSVRFEEVKKLRHTHFQV